MLEHLNGINEFKVYSVYDEEFKEYGRVLSIDNLDSILDYLDKNTSIPEKGNIYAASDEELEAVPAIREIQNKIFGEMDIQAGYCNGNNSLLNAFEYHKGSEVNVSSTGMVLFLGRVQKIENNYFNVENVKAFYVPKAAAIEIYSTTLHFSPCKIADNGFKCMVVLPRGTNTPLTASDRSGEGENRLLFMKNKWLIAHEDKKDLIERGAFKGLIGKNLECKY